MWNGGADQGSGKGKPTEQNSRFNPAFFKLIPADELEFIKLDPPTKEFLAGLERFADKSLKHIDAGQDLVEIFLDFFLDLENDGPLKIYFILSLRPTLSTTVINGLQDRYKPPLSKEKEAELFNSYKNTPRILAFLQSAIGKEIVETSIVNTLRANYTPLSKEKEEKLFQLYRKNPKMLAAITAAIGQEAVDAFISRENLGSTPALLH